MTKFALEWIEVPDCKVYFYKLLIDEDCPFDEFWEKMERSGNFEKDLDKIYTLVVLLSQKHRLPTDKFKELSGRKKDDPYRDFEIKAGRLRVYLFEDETEGKIIALGELKKDKKRQSKQIKRMRQIKLAYFDAKEENT
jgi:hypothetical protein